MQEEIRLGRGMSEELKAWTARFPRVFVLTDRRLESLYGKRLDALSPLRFVIPGGEASKSLSVYRELLENFQAAGLDRGDLVLAFGGGVTLDLGGFAASSWLRGLPFCSVPTSLLAMVDASVGGKNGLNFGGVKNQIGSFYAPSLVSIDLDYLETLDVRNMRNGLAEVIKAGLIGDAELYHSLFESFNPDFAVPRALKVKAACVEEDPFDQGKRQLLNLGHSLGHALEAEGDFLHGEAVGLGMLFMARASERLCLAEEPLSEELERLLLLHGLPVRCGLDEDALMARMRRDKKCRGDRITLVFPLRPGACERVAWPVDALPELFKAGRP